MRHYQIKLRTFLCCPFFTCLMFVAMPSSAADVTSNNAQKIKVLEAQVEKLQAGLESVLKEMTAANAELKALTQSQSALSSAMQIQDGKIVITSSGSLELRAATNILLKSSAATVDAGLVSLGSGSKAPASYQGSPVSISGTNGTVTAGSKSVLIAR